MYTAGSILKTIPVSRICSERGRRHDFFVRRNFRILPDHASLLYALLPAGDTHGTNGPGGKDAVRWLNKEWANVHRLKQDGVPIIGFTWYSLQDQVDWD